MDNNVLISIKTFQEAGGEELEPIELQTPGKFGVLNQKYYIMYDESEMTGFADTTTTIKVWPGHVVVTRRGKFNMRRDSGISACIRRPMGRSGRRSTRRRSTTDFPGSQESSGWTIPWTLTMRTLYRTP